MIKSPGASGGGGGGGVTSVGIASTDLSVSGSPITVSGNITLNINNGVVTNAKLANMAQATVKGRASGAGTGASVDLTATQLTAILNVFTTALSGAVPASGSAVGNFLRDDGTWAAAGGGSPGGADTQIQYNSSSAFAGSPNLTWNAGAQKLTVTGVGGTIGLNLASTGFNDSPFLQVASGDGFTATLQQLQGGGACTLTTAATIVSFKSNNSVIYRMNLANAAASTQVLYVNGNHDIIGNPNFTFNDSTDHLHVVFLDVNGTIDATGGGVVKASTLQCDAGLTDTSGNAIAQVAGGKTKVGNGAAPAQLIGPAGVPVVEANTNQVILFNGGITFDIVGAAPTSSRNTGSLAVDVTNGDLYINTSVTAGTTWSKFTRVP